jgi:thiol-disulfide isomerase/thioredoxin
MNRYINFNANQSSVLPIGNSKSSFLGGGMLNNTTYIIIAAIILFSILALFYYFYYVSAKSNVEYHANRERVPRGSDGSNGGEKTAELLFFGANWCPHCKAAKPIWDDLKTEYQNRTINGYQIIFNEIDCSEETPEVDKMMNQYNVEGYPTIKLLKDGQVIEYDAKPTKETLTQFLNTVL